jgi:hypothetical protein
MLHHKHAKDQARLSDWPHRRDGAQIQLRTHDGATHAAALFRLKHCFGRGLLLYSDAVDVQAKDVITIELEAAQ